MSAERRRQALERRIGYRFRDTALLEQALTHPSAVGSGAGQLGSYQRLEFLGDRVLGLVVADMLLQAFPGADEGALHRRHAGLVRKETCAEVGAELGIGAELVLSEGESNSGGRTKETILGDACEAVIGAIYCDGGLEPARALIDRIWRERMTGSDRPPRDAKSTLQEWAQASGLPTPRYAVIDETGPQHAPRFSVRVDVGAFAPATAEGPSKREAEQGAAAAFLAREDIGKAGRK